MTSDINAQRRTALYATLTAVLVRTDPSLPELDLVHRWLDNWRGVGLIIDGMLRQGFAVDLSATHTTGWSVIILKDRPSGGAAEIVASAHHATPWRAVQIASWNARSTASRCREVAVQRRRRALASRERIRV